MNFTYEPLVMWPGKLTKKRRRAPFRASYGKTLDLLERELAHLGARDVILQVAMRREDIRIDGRPRSGAKATHPGVVMTFESKHGPLSYPCDRFDNHEDNIRAIALSLEHLRAVDRYGVTMRGEQYKGWAALEDKRMKPNEAAELLAAVSDCIPREIMQSREVCVNSYRQACMKTHPDRGGRVDDFQGVQEAYRVLTAMFDAAEKRA